MPIFKESGTNCVRLLLTKTLSVIMPSFWLTAGISLSKLLIVRSMPLSGSSLKKSSGSSSANNNGCMNSDRIR